MIIKCRANFGRNCIAFNSNASILCRFSLAWNFTWFFRFNDRVSSKVFRSISEIFNWNFLICTINARFFLKICKHSIARIVWLDNTKNITISKTKSHIEIFSDESIFFPLTSSIFHNPILQRLHLVIRKSSLKTTRRYVSLISVAMGSQRKQQQKKSSFEVYHCVNLLKIRHTLSCQVVVHWERACVSIRWFLHFHGRYRQG